MRGALWIALVALFAAAGFATGCVVGRAGPLMPAPSAPATCPASGEPSVEVHFSPHHGADVGCTVAVDALIGSAKTSIRMAAYGLTSEPIAAALVAARKRGVDVQVTVDKSNEGTRAVDELEAAGVVVRIDRRHAIAHQKLIVVDDEAIEEGSFNYTKAAEHSNAELCVIFRSKARAAEFLSNWEEHRQHSEAP